MGKQTGISWCDHTWNPWVGCAKVSDGCKFCYAEADMDHRRHFAKWGPNGSRVRTSPTYWKQPIAWDKEAARDGIRRKVFCASLADVFEDFPGLDDYRDDLWNLIGRCKNLDWLILTKRPENIRRMLPVEDQVGMSCHWPHIWLGTSAEDQETFDTRRLWLASAPAALRFLSIEPLLGPIRSESWHRIDWVILGGESGPKARPCHLEWLRSIKGDCERARVPVFVKQLGSEPHLNGMPFASISNRTLHDYKWGHMGEWPDDLRVRDFPSGPYIPMTGEGTLFR